MSKEKKEKTPYVIEVDGVQVFSADYVFTQMGVQSCRIDLLWTVLKWSWLVWALFAIGGYALIILLTRPL